MGSADMINELGVLFSGVGVWTMVFAAFIAWSQGFVGEMKWVVAEGRIPVPVEEDDVWVMDMKSHAFEAAQSFVCPYEEANVFLGEGIGEEECRRKILSSRPAAAQPAPMQETMVGRPAMDRKPGRALAAYALLMEAADNGWKKGQ